MTVRKLAVRFGMRLRWPLLAAVAFGCAGAGAAQEVTTRIVAITDPDSWFGKGDNPADLPRDPVPVGFILEVDAAGAVTGCTVTVPSRVGRLDESSCELLRERARFHAPRTADGSPAAGAFVAWLTWQRGKPPHVAPPLNGKMDRSGAPLASPAENPVPWFAAVGGVGPGGDATAVITAEVDAVGTMTGCRVLQGSDSPTRDAQGCALMREHGVFRPAFDALGRPVPGAWSVTISWR